MARKRVLKPTVTQFVNFDYEERTYQIDPDLKKVYRRFVEIETSKASLILTHWRASVASA